MKGIGATRSSGRSEGSVGVTPTGIELGLKVGGIGQLGISTDYGGGIVVAIFGQKIVWGREGGKIHYNFGVLEVLVEARNCVVVETRKIAGQVVASHVYPDPGCKLPEPEPSTPSSSGPKGIGWTAENMPPLDENCIYKFKLLLLGDVYEYYNRLEDNYQSTRWERVERLSPQTNTTVLTGFGANGDSVTVAGEGRQHPEGTESGINQPGQFILDQSPEFRKVQNFGIAGNDVSPAVFRSYLIGYYNKLNVPFTVICRKLSCGGIPQPFEQPSAPPSPLILLPPSAGNRPPMPESCCEALSADIEDIKEVLATKEILAGKMTFPWSWRMPGGQGEEVIMDYPNLMRAIAQMIDHLGIHPPKLSIKDINNAVAGDQSVSNQFPSATQGFEALMAQIWDANADVDTLTNFLYRLSWLCVQQSMNLARISGDVQSIKDMIGGETAPTDTSITTPFNIAAGVVEKSTKGQGFGKEQGKIDNRIDANTEFATEQLLPEFLRIRENPIVVERFSGEKDLYDLMAIIILKLESLQRT